MCVGWWYGNMESELVIYLEVVIYWLWPFSLFLLFIRFNKIQLQCFPFLESPVTLSMKQSMTWIGLQRLFLHKMQGNTCGHKPVLTWAGLRSHFTHTILSCQIYVKADEINLLHWISCFERSCVFCWCDLILLELWQKWDLSQGPRCGSSHCASCCGAGSAHLGEGTWCQGSHGNSCGAEDPDITGSVAQEQAAKPLGPRFSFGTKPGFLNPNILH